MGDVSRCVDFGAHRRRPGVVDARWTDSELVSTVVAIDPNCAGSASYTRPSTGVGGPALSASLSAWTARPYPGSVWSAEYAVSGFEVTEVGQPDVDHGACWIC